MFLHSRKARFPPIRVHFTLPEKHATDVLAVSTESWYTIRSSEAKMSPVGTIPKTQDPLPERGTAGSSPLEYRMLSPKAIWLRRCPASSGEVPTVHSLPRFKEKAGTRISFVVLFFPSHEFPLQRIECMFERHFPPVKPLNAVL